MYLRGLLNIPSHEGPVASADLLHQCDVLIAIGETIKYFFEQDREYNPDAFHVGTKLLIEVKSSYTLREHFLQVWYMSVVDKLEDQVSGGMCVAA
jgi:hypothetical protein